MASYEDIGFDFSLKANTAGSPYQVVALGIADEFKVPTGTCGSAGGPIGILQNGDSLSASQMGMVRGLGVSKAWVDTSNSAISVGEYLAPMPASSHKLEPHAPTVTGSPFAIAFEAVASGSAFIKVWILGPLANNV